MAEVTPAAAELDRPAVIFDVDGTLRVFADMRPDNYLVQENQPMFAYNPEIAAPIREVLSRTDVDGYYISLHRGNCHSYIGRILQLPELDWINDDPFRPQAIEFTERALAIGGLFGNRPVAWVDDEITDRDYVWAERRIAPTLLMRTDPDIGLTLRQAGLVESWLELL